VVNPVPHGGGEGADLSQGDSAEWKKFMTEAPLSEKAKRDYDDCTTTRKTTCPA